MLSVYLAGAIRDGHPEDISWREEAIDALGNVANILNPLGGKTYNVTTKEWLCHGEPTEASVIVKHDFWCVDNVDAAIFNFLSLADGYPSIGTLVEFGRSTARGVLAYSIVPVDYTGHLNTKMFKLHPFIEQNSAMIFSNPADCLDFVGQHFMVLSGFSPRFGGELKEQEK